MRDAHSAKETPEYAWSAIRRHTGRMKKFGSWTYAKSKMPALCQVKGCTEVAKWAVNFGDKAIVLCFAHGEDC